MLKDIKNSYLIQVGDFGIGFNDRIHDVAILEDLNGFLRERNCVMYVIHGNHDNPSFFDGDINFDCLKLLPDYSVINLKGWGNILLIGGAISIDRVYRVEEARSGTKVYWWKDEKVIFDPVKLESIKDIDIVVTHTAPDYCYPDNRMGFPPIVTGFVKYDPNLLIELNEERSLMTQIFDLINKNSKVKTHLYGHFHSSRKEIHNDTEHILLGINEMYEIKKS
jgi:DNA repair exonuclease SbcCD nuclease subunit